MPISSGLPRAKPASSSSIKQLRKKLEQVEREHKDLKRAYFQLSLRQRNQGNEKDGAQVTASEQRGRASGAGLAPHGGAQCARAGGCVARG